MGAVDNKGTEGLNINPSVPFSQDFTEKPAMNIRYGFVLWMILLAAPWAVVAAEEPDPLAALPEPGTALLLRHALAPGIGDPPGFDLQDCSTQRNLSDAGRAQARALGERLRALGVSSARVYSSRWCRCLETARLLDLGPVRPLPALDSFFQQRSAAQPRTRAAREFLRALPPGPPAILVTHQVNISALTGRFTDSGTGVLVRSSAAGEVEVLEE